MLSGDTQYVGICNNENKANIKAVEEVRFLEEGEEQKKPEQDERQSQIFGQWKSTHLGAI